MPGLPTHDGIITLPTAKRALQAGKRANERQVNGQRPVPSTMARGHRGFCCFRLILRQLLRPPGGKPRPPVAIRTPRWQSAPPGDNPRSPVAIRAPRWHSAPSGVNPRHLLPIRSVAALHALAAGAQWPETFITERKVGALQILAACTR